MAAIDILREKLEKNGWTILSLRELNQRFKNSHTGQEVKVVFEYHVRDGVGFSPRVYVLSGGGTWQTELFHTHFTRA
jgi:hypothetical protein